MKKKFKPLYFSIHYSFIILAIGSIFFNLFGLLIMYFVCLCLHEGVHALVAKRLGYKLSKIKLLATGASLEASSDEFSFSDEIYIAISAPLFNLLVALGVMAFWWIIPESYNYTQDLCVINFAICFFNLLPIFPLDGGRVLLASLCKKLPRSNALKIAKTITICFSFLLFFIFILSIFISINFSFAIMSITLFVGAITEDKSATYKRYISFAKKKEQLTKKPLDIKYVSVKYGVSVFKLIKYIDARHYTIFLLLDESLNEVEKITEGQLLKMIEQSQR